MKIKIFLLMFLCFFLLAGRALALEGSCDFLLNNGDSANKINFIFIAENFQDKEEFINIARGFIGLEGNNEFTLLNYAPYSDFKNEYNIYSLYEEGKDYECESSDRGKASFISGEGDFCFDPKVALEYLKSKCGEEMYDIDYIIIISKKNFRSSADHYTESEINPRTRIIRISYDTSQITPGYEEEVLENSKRTFIHEIGHSLGFLTDEYVDLGKKEYRPVSPIGSANVDVAGCPKWCSGQLSINNEYYSEYAEYQECIQGLDERNSEDDDDFLRCYAEVINTPETSAFNSDFGIGCEGDSGCYWGAGGLNGFRSRECSMMKFETCPELGSVNEGIARQGLTNIIHSRKLNIQEMKFEINNVILVSTNEDELVHQYKFRVDFKLTNQDGEPIIIRVNKLNYDLYSEVNGIGRQNLVFLNTEDNSYYTLYEHLVSKKEREDLKIVEGQKVNIDFVAKYNDIESIESYVLDLYDVRISESNGAGKVIEGNNPNGINNDKGFFARLWEWLKSLF